MKSPYIDLPDSSFWKLAVPNKIDLLENIYKQKFSILNKKIATAGDCFAQEIHRALKKSGCLVIDNEPSPNTIAIRGEIENSFGYGLYSARHGNIYSARQLLQLAKEAFGISTPSPEDYIWEKDNRFYDALRPSVEPNGLTSKEEVIMQRQDHIKRFRMVLESCDIFIFTMGLTESWIGIKNGLVYPTAPGVIAGTYNPDLYQFYNFKFMEIYNDFLEFRKIVKLYNPSVKFLLTISPVPLTATASGKHVLAATVYSKSIVRAVAGQLYDEYDDIDYFPSYEILTTPFLGAFMFMENKRTVTKKGVAMTMEIFIREHTLASTSDVNNEEEVHGKTVCDEALLDAFAGGNK